MSNTTIAEIARSMRHEIIGLRRADVDWLQPPKETVVRPGDQLLIFSERSDLTVLEEAVRSAPKKIVIIDDNPVIVRLYARLFQRAGFTPSPPTAGTAAWP